MIVNSATGSSPNLSGTIATTGTTKLTRSPDSIVSSTATAIFSRILQKKWTSHSALFKKLEVISLKIKITFFLDSRIFSMAVKPATRSTPTVITPIYIDPT